MKALTIVLIFCGYFTVSMALAADTSPFDQTHAAWTKVLKGHNGSTSPRAP